MTERLIEVPVDRLDKAPWNYKTDDDFMTDRLAENLKRNGQIENLIVREMEGERFEVVNGNHRLDVLGALGFPTAVCWNLGVISEAAAKRIAVETNETQFAADGRKLAGLIVELSGEFDGADLEATLPFTHYEIENFRSLSEISWPEPDGNVEWVAIKVTVSPKVKGLWDRWRSRIAKKSGYQSDAKALEFAVVEAMNAPLEEVVNAA